MSAAAVAIIGAIAAQYLVGRRERRARLAERRQRIYMMLLGLHQTHFWISSGDMPMPDRDIPKEIKDQYQREAWRIIDELRTVDELKQGPAIIDMLIGLRFEHEWQRAEAMQKIIDELARDVTPRIRDALRRRDRHAMELVARDSDEWWRRRGKIEPMIPTPKEHERRRRGADRDEDESPPADG